MSLKFVLGRARGVFHIFKTVINSVSAILKNKNNGHQIVSEKEEIVSLKYVAYEEKTYFAENIF